MSTVKKSNIETIILALFKEKTEVTVKDVMQELGTLDESKRRAVIRVLNSLIERQIVTAKGVARARVYILVSRQETARISYNQDFLRLYEPNKTMYLSTAERKELYDIGVSENVIRPAGTYARNILSKFLIDLSWNSSRLEGNTYSLLQTQRLIEFGENAEGKDIVEAQMILNHKAAIEYVVESADEDKISSRIVLSIHALLSENLLGNPASSGKLRQISVGISGSNYVPLDNPYTLRENFEVFIEKINLIRDPFEQSFFALVHLSYMQAFEDVNKRTARLVANIPFVRKNLKPLSFIEVDKGAYASALIKIYEKNDFNDFKELYISAYKKSCQRYSAMQQAMDNSSMFRFQHRLIIHEIIRFIVINEIAGADIVSVIKDKIKTLKLPADEEARLLEIVETEILSLHEGNAARFKIRPSEFKHWKALQS